MLKTILLLSFTTMGSMEQKSLEVNQKEKQYRCIVSCGTCMFQMEGKGCKLAVKIDTTYYFVEGAGIDDFGDAHATDGFCNAIKKAKVRGVIQGNIFVANKIEILGATTSKKIKENK